MNKEQKGHVIEEVHEKFSSASVAIVTHYRGLTVAEMTQLRRGVRQAGAEYRVIKNTLARRASRNTAYEPISDLLSGPTGIVLTAKDPVASAKALTEFAKTHPKLVIIGGVLAGKKLDSEAIEALSKLPSKEVLVARLLGTMMRPLQGIVGVLAAVPGGFVRVVDQIRQQKESANG
ncbi:MAG: 50S ribosomal protein L10 [Magnetococcus sp. DMHC-6]